jgi:uncharacterized protein (DUF2062 family)
MLDVPNQAFAVGASHLRSGAPYSFTPMSHEEHRRQRHSRVRRAKAFLRYMPRRAVFHRYPFIGRFAQMARKRPYLWSMKPQNLTRAFYAGSILSLLPVMGVQLPLAFALALLLRTNLMVMGGLQFITNPATAAPIYAGTYIVGQAIINRTGLAPEVDVEPEFAGSLAAGEDIEIATVPVDPPHPNAPRRWTSRVAGVVNALVIGGVVCGALLGAALDVSYRLTRQHGRLKYPQEPGASPGSSPGSTDGKPLPK